MQLEVCNNDRPHVTHLFSFDARSTLGKGKTRNWRQIRHTTSLLRPALCCLLPPLASVYSALALKQARVALIQTKASLISPAPARLRCLSFPRPAALQTSCSGHFPLTLQSHSPSWKSPLPRSAMTLTSLKKSMTKRQFSSYWTHSSIGQRSATPLYRIIPFLGSVMYPSWLPSATRASPPLQALSP